MGPIVFPLKLLCAPQYRTITLASQTRTPKVCCDWSASPASFGTPHSLLTHTRIPQPHSRRTTPATANRTLETATCLPSALAAFLSQPHGPAQPSCWNLCLFVMPSCFSFLFSFKQPPCSESHHMPAVVPNASHVSLYFLFLTILTWVQFLLPLTDEKIHGHRVYGADVWALGWQGAEPVFILDYLTLLTTHTIINPSLTGSLIIPQSLLQAHRL